MAKLTDLFVNIGAKTGDLDKGLNKAKQSTQDFGNEAGKIASGLKFAFIGMFGAIGAGALVFSNLKRTIEATQITGDIFEKTMRQIRAAVDYFFISLSIGDFSNFIQGLKDSIKAAGDLADTLDVLEDVNRGLSITKAKNRPELIDLALIYRDRTGKYSRDERQKAFNDARSIMVKQSTDEYNSFVREANAMLGDLAAKTGLTVNTIKDIIENYQGKYETQFKDIQTKLESVGGRNAQLAFVNFLKGDEKTYAQLYFNYGKATSEKLDAVAKSLTNQYNAEASVKEVSLDLIRIYNELFNIQKHLSRL